MHKTRVNRKNKYMKTLFCFAVGALIAFAGCNKTSLSQMAAGTWQLVQKQSNIASPYTTITQPSADSSVLLILDADNTYETKLNEQIISQGTCSVTIDAAYNNTQVLQLDNFATTGIFSPFIINEVGTNGQVLSSFSGFFMTINNDTLTLQTPYTPGGYIAYTFVKK